MGANHNDQSAFYVGYLPKAPGTYTKKIRLFIILVFLAIPLIALLLVRSQQGFIASTYDYANLTELSGILITNPFPALQIKVSDNDGNNVTQIIPLVAFGKKGIQEELMKLWDDHDISGRSLNITVVGNLIFYDGKTLLEVKEWGEWSKNAEGREDPVLLESSVSFTGEILDSKCFFGVMKPGHGKPHRSCAARCISGGIPPVLSIKEASGKQHYYLLTGPREEAINDELLPWIAQAVTLSGTIYKYDDWEVLQVDSKSLQRLATQILDLDKINSITLCNN